MWLCQRKGWEAEVTRQDQSVCPGVVRSGLNLGPFASQSHIRRPYYTRTTPLHTENKHTLGSGDYYKAIPDTGSGALKLKRGQLLCSLAIHKTQWRGQVSNTAVAFFHHIMCASSYSFRCQRLPTSRKQANSQLAKRLRAFSSVDAFSHSQGC